VLLHICHRVSLLLLRRWLLRSNNIITRKSAVSTSALLRRVRALRIGKLADLLLLLLQRDLFAGKLLLIFQQQSARKLLVQLGLFGYGWLFACWSMVYRDVVRIAHGEESIDRAVLISAHGIDDGVQEGRIEIREDRVQRAYLGICKLVDVRPFWKRGSSSNGEVFLPFPLLARGCWRWLR